MLKAKNTEKPPLVCRQAMTAACLNAKHAVAQRFWPFTRITWGTEIW